MYELGNQQRESLLSRASAIESGELPLTPHSSWKKKVLSSQAAPNQGWFNVALGKNPIRTNVLSSLGISGLGEPLILQTGQHSPLNLYLTCSPQLPSHPSLSVSDTAPSSLPLLPETHSWAWFAAGFGISPSTPSLPPNTSSFLSLMNVDLLSIKTSVF